MTSLITTPSKNFSPFDERATRDRQRRFVQEAVREMVPYHRASKFPDPTARMGSLGSYAPYLKDHAAWA